MTRLYSKPLTARFPKLIGLTLILIVSAPQTHSLAFKDEYRVIFNGHKIATLKRNVNPEGHVAFQFSENIMQHPPQTSPSGYKTTDDIESSINLKVVEEKLRLGYWEDRYILPDRLLGRNLNAATFYFNMRVKDKEGPVTNLAVPLKPVHNEHLIDDNLPRSIFPYAFIRRLIGRNKSSASLVHHTFSDESKNYDEYRGADYVEYRISLNENHHEERTTERMIQFHKKHNNGVRKRRSKTSILNGIVIPGDIEVNRNSNGDVELLACHGPGADNPLCDFHTESSRHSVYEGPACIEPHEEHSGCEMDCKKPPSIPNRSSALQTILQALASSHDRDPEQIRHLFLLGETMAHYFNELVNDQSSEGAMAPEQIAVFDPLSSTSGNIIGAYQMFIFDQQTNMIHQRDPDNDSHPSFVTTDYQLNEERTEVVRIAITDSNPTRSRAQVLVFDATGDDSPIDEPIDVREEDMAGLEAPDDGMSAMPITPSSIAPLNTTEEDTTGAEEFRPYSDNLLRELPSYPGAKQ